MDTISPMQAVITAGSEGVTPVNYITTYTSQLKTQGGGAAGGRRGRKAGMQFSDLETVRGLVHRLGAEQVKELVDMAEKFA